MKFEIFFFFKLGNSIIFWLNENLILSSFFFCFALLIYDIHGFMEPKKYEE